MKVVLSLQNERIPGNIHLQEINPHIALDELPVEIPTAPVPWRRGEATRIAGVSSFGLSGTNAHVIVEEAPPQDDLQEARTQKLPAELLLLSARTPDALTALAGIHAARG